MTIRVRPYQPWDSDSWDIICNNSLQGTLLHTRRFLSYHGNRFADKSLLIEYDGNCVGVFPAALNPLCLKTVESHPGATYGGVVHSGTLKGPLMVETLVAICRYFRENGIDRVVYKTVPSIYHRAPAQDDLYALFRVGARRFRCDLSSTIDLDYRLPVSERRRRAKKKAEKTGVQLSSEPQNFPKFWGVLEGSLARRHGVFPTHSLGEIQLLNKLFPNNILCTVAKLDNEVIAGIVVFSTRTAHHTQYIAASETGFSTSALDIVLEEAIETAAREGKRWFDFGTSNESGGYTLNEGLYSFKSQFGGGGFAYEFYEINTTEV